MAVCRFSDYQCKEVVNVCDGCRLGFVRDLEVDMNDGRICAIYAPGPWRWNSVFRRSCYRIPWSCIRQIGNDLILVEADLSACQAGRPARRTMRSRP